MERTDPVGKATAGVALSPLAILGGLFSGAPASNPVAKTSAKVNSAIERIEAQIAAKRVALDVDSARPADPVAIARAMANHVCHGGKRPSTFGLTAAQRLWIEGLDQSQAVRVQQVDAKTIGAFLAGGAQVKGFAPLESAKDVADFERGYRRGVAKIDAETAAIPLPVGVTV